MQFLNNNKLSLKKASLYTSNTNMFNLKQNRKFELLVIIYKKSHFDYVHLVVQKKDGNLQAGIS